MIENALYLFQHGFPPVIIRKQDRLQYYQYLVTANEGDVRCDQNLSDLKLLRCSQNFIMTAGSNKHSNYLAQCLKSHPPEGFFERQRPRFGDIAGNKLCLPINEEIQGHRLLRKNI